jgi:D-alanyl-D-alanine carboxypeptidase/D-alanyl-D-alanine-endopeptidase (penicillin-binding protein 4)
VREIAGRLIGHEGAFEGERRGSDWTWEDLVWRYGAEVSALSFADNCVLLTGSSGERTGEPLRMQAEPESSYYTLDVSAVTSAAGSESELRLVRDFGGNVIELSGTHPRGVAPWEGCVALEDPARWTASVFAERLRDRGVRLVGGVSTSSETLPEDARVLASHDGAPLMELLPQINRKSSNLHTELLLRRLGLAAGEAGTVEEGHAVVLGFLKRLGVDPAGFTLRDASGLSRTNLVTAGAMAQFLVAMAKHPAAEALRASMAIPGEEGTLEHRFRDRPEAAARVRAKTGTLRHTFGLAGYADSRSGARLAFAIYLNHHAGTPGAAVWAIDSIVGELLSR